MKYNHDRNCTIFDGDAKNSTGKQQKQGGESFKFQTWLGKKSSQWVFLLRWRGSVSAGSFLGGVLKYCPRSSEFEHGIQKKIRKF